MIRKMLLAIAAVAALGMGAAQPAASPQWHDAASMRITGRSLTDPRQTNGVEVFADNAAITIRTTRRVQVSVYTILGQLVSQATLQPGTSTLRLSSRGIYLVKIDGITQKVAI